MDYKRKTIKQFDKWATSYDNGPWSFYFNAAYKGVLSEIENKLTRGTHVLDLACGTGALSQSLAKKLNVKVAGVDISPEMIKIASKKSIPRRVDFICSDIEDLNLPKNSFDAVFCLNSFHHFQKHSNVFYKINKLLKKGGYFILLDPFEDNPLRKLWSTFLKRVFREKHVKYFKRKELNFMATKNHFEIEKQKTFMYFTLLSILKKPN